MSEYSRDDFKRSDEISEGLIEENNPLFRHGYSNRCLGAILWPTVCLRSDLNPGVADLADQSYIEDGKEYHFENLRRPNSSVSGPSKCSRMIVGVSRIISHELN